MRGHSGLDGVVRDVPEALEKVAVGLDELGPVRASFEMPGASPAAVEHPGVRPIQEAHAGLQEVFLDLDEEVIVRAHQAKRVAYPGESVDRSLKPIAEVGAVEVIAKHLHRSGAAPRDVVDAGIDGPSSVPCHAPRMPGDLSRNCGVTKLRGRWQIRLTGSIPVSVKAAERERARPLRAAAIS